jgi:vancomycin resistance protein YoaR
VTIDKVNELGIEERIGRGESYYAHSIPNRIFNVGLASDRINSALIAPGEEVSFNKLVGEVSAATGYRSAYIISQGRTVLGDGGGLCQVSTTLFRAAMNAGLPILERWGHSYRVSYYEQNSSPGIDATVIAPSKDFRFKNDTPGHILIQTINDPKNLHLVIEIYGTSDGRVASVTEPKVWGITPPLPTVYQDDPSLPSGTMKQVDWSASGARASFEYKVTRDGETLQDQTFSTVYRPWAAVYLRGTGQ